MRKDFTDMTLAELAYDRATCQLWIEMGVREARAGGSTWAAIGSSLGVTGSEAHRRYRWVEISRKD